MERVWSPGDLVRVLDGPFAELTGTVEAVDAEHGTLRVSLTVSGAACRVELRFDDVQAYDVDRPPASGARWRRGDSVRVLAGVFQYLTGIVQTADEASGRVIVRLAGLRPEVCVEFGYDDIESV